MTIRSNTRIRKGGVLVGSADELNLIEGSGVTITAASVAPRDVDVTIAATAGAGGAPTDADYLVGTANGDLSGEIVVGTTPGGELGNTWASPTVDATHSGSTHAAAQAAAEATAATALSTHEADTTSIHGITNTAALETTTGSQTKVDTHVNDAAAAHAATAVAFTPAGTIAATDVQAAIEEVASEAGGGGAPTDADYLVGTANGSLSGEIVVGTTPGGELGGTWASPTVDATHSGSTHGAATTTHEAAADPHTGYVLESLLDAAGDLYIASAADTPARLARGSEGQVLAATGSTVAWSSLTFSRGGTILDPSGARHVMVWRAPYACTVTNVRGHRKGGTGATINARLNQTSDHLASDLSLTNADAWMDGGAVQNTAYAAGDDLEIEIASITGAVTEIAIQVDFTRP